MDCSTPGFPGHHQLLELAQTHVHWVSDAIQPLHPLSSPSPPAFNLSQHQGLFQWVRSSHQVAKILEFQLHHQSFQWTFELISFRIDWFDLLAVQGTLKSLIQHYTSLQLEKVVSSNKDPVQPKINKQINNKFLKKNSAFFPYSIYFCLCYGAYLWDYLSETCLVCKLCTAQGYVIKEENEGLNPAHSPLDKSYILVVVQLLSHVHLFVTPWSEAHQVSLSFTASRWYIHPGIQPQTSTKVMLFY